MVKNILFLGARSSWSQFHMTDSLIPIPQLTMWAMGKCRPAKQGFCMTRAAQHKDTLKKTSQKMLIIKETPIAHHLLLPWITRRGTRWVEALKKQLGEVIVFIDLLELRI